MKEFKKYLAECLGTGVLVLLACGVAILTKGNIFVTALAFGLVIVAMAYSIGNISGCHINPAVSLAMFLTGRMKLKEFIGYVIAQCIGAIAAAALLMLFAKGAKDGGLGSNALYRGDILLSLAIEIVLTFLFVFVILEVTSKKENGAVAGLVIGLTLTLVHLFGIPFTGTSVNPARSLGPAIFAGGEALSVVWVFIVGPFAGGALAALVYKLFHGAKKEQ